MKFSSGSVKVSCGETRKAVSVRIATPLLIALELTKTSYFLPLASLRDAANLEDPLIPLLLTNCVSHKDMMSVSRFLLLLF